MITILGKGSSHTKFGRGFLHANWYEDPVVKQKGGGRLVAVLLSTWVVWHLQTQEEPH